MTIAFMPQRQREFNELRARGVQLPSDVDAALRSLHPHLKRRDRAAVDLPASTPRPGSR